MSEETTITISDHAFEKAKERLRLKKKAFERLAATAFVKGIKHGDTVGRLNKFVTKTYLSHRTANNIRIYGENIYIFAGQTLITVYQLPNNLKKAANKK